MAESPPFLSHGWVRAPALRERGKQRCKPIKRKDGGNDDGMVPTKHGMLSHQEDEANYGVALYSDIVLQHSLSGLKNLGY